MTETASIVIPRLKSVSALVPLVGTSPLIVHKWSEKAKRQMLDAQQGKKHAKQIRDPKADYESSLYHTADGGFGFPVIAFKAAFVRAGKLMGVKMTDARQCIFVRGDAADDNSQELAPIDGTPTMREDMVRVGTGTDLRYRAQFLKWRTVLKVKFYPNLISQESLLSLIEFGGETVGIGEWRPEKNGEFGTYRIDDTKNVEVTA